MARLVPIELQDKLRLVQTAVVAARGADRRHFDFTTEVAPGVRLVLGEVGDTPLALSLWDHPQDIAELCGDAAYPATAALLAIDSAQALAVIAGGHTFDLGQFTRSESNPSIYYVLFDHVSRRQVRTVLHRMIPGLESLSVAA